MQFLNTRAASIILLKILAISILLSAGCRSFNPKSSEIWDNSLMASNPCSAPCFFGIEPGITSLTEAEDLLQAAGLCLDPYYIRSSSPTEPESIFCEDWTFVHSDSGKEITRSVSFEAPNELTAKMVFDQLGYPDAVTVDAYGKDAYGEGDRKASYMNLYYVDGFTLLVLYEQDTGDYHLKKDTLVDWIGYYEEGFFEELFENTSPWSGYGVYPPDF
jgi:hypothetical protein